MNNKFFYFLFILCALSIASNVWANETEFGLEERIFKARVLEIVSQQENFREDGSVSLQQKIKLQGLEDQWQNKEIIFDGTEFDAVSSNKYATGDIVLINYSPGPQGEENYYILGYSRSKAIYWLIFIFALIAILIGRLKGFRALVVLILTFLIILNYIIPKILAGANPLLISLFGSLFILVLAIYITEGFKKTSTIAVFSILIALLFTGLISYWFSSLAKLTGFASEEAAYLVGLSGGVINIKGLLLAGIIIGALGVLDDVVISQIMLVKELKESNPDISDQQVYKHSMQVGISHLSSMINTLFLAYAGAALPLLILFNVKQAPFLTFNQVIDNEMMATEIVRTLAGSIGLILAVPLSTYLAVKFLSKKIS